MRSRLLDRAADLAVTRPLAVLGAGVVLTAISLFGAARLELHLALSDLFPDRSEERGMLEYANEHLGGLDRLFIVLRGEDPAALSRATEAVAEGLRDETEHLAAVHYRIDLDWFRRHALLFADAGDLESLADAVEADAPRGRALGRLLTSGGFASPLAGVTELLAETALSSGDTGDDRAEGDGRALEILDGLAAWLQAAGAAGDSEDNALAPRHLPTLVELVAGDVTGVAGRGAWSGGSDAYLDETGRYRLLSTPDGTARLLLVAPTEQTYDYDHALAVLGAVDRVLDDVLPRHPGIAAETTGTLAIMREEHAVVGADMLRATIVAAAGLLVLFLFVMRRPGEILLLGGPLVASILWTVGFASFAFGHLNVLTAIFAPILLGLGVDFGIHLTNRFLEERAEGRDVPESIRTTVRISGRGIVTGGLATSAAFLVMATAQYEGMRQMGIVCGVGILFALVAMLLLVPALLALVGERLHPPPAPPRIATLSGDLAALVVRRPGWTVAGGALLTAVALFGLTRLSFDYDIRSLEPRDMAAMKAMGRLESAFGITVDYGLVIAKDGEDERRILARLSDRPSVGRVDAASLYLPTDPARKLPALRRLVDALDLSGNGASAPDLEAETAALSDLAQAARAVVQMAVLEGSPDVEDRARTLAGLADSLAGRLELGERPAGWAPLTARLSTEREMLMAATRAALDEGGGLDAADLPAELASGYLDGYGRRLVYVYPEENLWDERVMAVHVADLQAAGGEGYLGIGVVVQRLIRMVTQDLRAAALYAVLAVALILLLDFRSPIKAALALVPLLCGTVWLLGVLPLLGMTLNHVNVAMVPILVGIGIDDGVHIMHRYEAERGERRDAPPQEAVRRTAAFTGHAILLTSLTTAVGFAAIGLADNRGLSSLGVAVALGIGACYLASVILLPALLSLTWKARTWLSPSS